MRQSSTLSNMSDSQSATALEKSAQLEIELIQRVVEQRDHAAMERLYHLYRSQLGSFLYRMMPNKALVDEIYNEVMVVVWQKASQFNGQSKLSTWIYAIAYRQCLQSIRKENKHSRDDSEELLNNLVTAEEPHESELITLALKKLSDDHRQVIELSYFTGCNYKEIGKIVGKSENTIKTRMFHAKKKMKESIIRLRSRGYQ